jgi:hypothetical protein
MNTEKKNEFEFLVLRARHFMNFLEENKIDSIFPLREESKKELEQRIQSGSLRRMKIFDNIVNNLLIGKNSLSVKDQLKAITYLEEKMGAVGVKFIAEKLALFGKIKSKGVIKSRLEILEAIEIMNSSILGLSDEDKEELKEIIGRSMLMRI